MESILPFLVILDMSIFPSKSVSYICKYFPAFLASFQNFPRWPDFLHLMLSITIIFDAKSFDKLIFTQNRLESN